MTWKPIIIGMNPGPRTDPTEPLYPDSRCKSGLRLCNFMKLDPSEYLELFERRNLIPERTPKWPHLRARKLASAMQPELTGRWILLVGSRVSDAFGFSSNPLNRFVYSKSYVMGCIPHTSGLNRYYNYSQNILATESCLEQFVDEARKLRTLFAAETVPLALDPLRVP